MVHAKIDRFRVHYRFNKMGLCDDAIEYNYNKNSEQALVNEIIETFIGCKL